jgi:S-adenosylmethionine-diacylglycerol 3-amino-3-carboxypropyl transferase
MKRIVSFRKVEFEWRIFISLGIVILVSSLSIILFPSLPDNIVKTGTWLGMGARTSLKAGYLFVAFLMAVASLIRMWAGSILSSNRVMAFRIQKNSLLTKGPYCMIRNPIYLADLIAFFGFALCLNPVGFVLPVLLILHYYQLILYEEKNLAIQFGESFRSYCSSTSRFLPRFSDLPRIPNVLGGFSITFDGFRYNALYVLFVIGFIVAAFTGSLLSALIIGVPAVIDWAIIHTIKGKTSCEETSVDNPAKANKGRLAKSNVFKDIIYAQCWEDPSLDREAFNINSEDVIFSITSGGCNALAFLLDNPGKVIALDLSPYQNYMLDLKIAAFRAFDYAEMLEFLGVTDSGRRLEMYQLARPYLMKESSDYWDVQSGKIQKGVIHSGRYEKYMHLLKNWFRVLLGSKLVNELFEMEGEKERQEFYEKKWNSLSWKIFTKVLLSRKVMSFLFTKQMFAQLEGSFSFGDHFRKRIKRAVTDLPLKENSFLAYILLGRFYSLDHLPQYLRKENFLLIKNRVQRIEIINASCEDYFGSLSGDNISKFNFTNIFEWMEPEIFESLLRETIRVGKNGSVITYRNLLVPRNRPETLSGSIVPQIRLSEKLHNKDLSFIYRAYVVEHIRK